MAQFGDQERVWFAREAVRLLVKALKNLKLYEKQHVHVTSARDEFLRSLRNFLKLYETLRLEVTKDTFKLDDQRLYDEPSREANFAWKLFIGGVRDFAIQGAVSDEEVSKFLDVLATRDGNKDLATLLYEAALTKIEYSCLDELAEGWDVAENLSQESLETIQEMNQQADKLIDVLKQKRLVADAGSEVEVTDSGDELSQVESVIPGTSDGDEEGGGDDDDEDDDIFVVPEERVAPIRAEVAALGFDQLVGEVVEVILDGLILDRDAVGEERALWYLEEATRTALQRSNLQLCAALLDRYAPLLEGQDEALAATIRKVFAELQSTERVERLLDLSVSAGAIGGPPALCQILRRLGAGGVEVAIMAFLRAKNQELKDALEKLIGETIVLAPEMLRRLLEPNVPRETARWALFLVSKRIKGKTAEQLYELGMGYPEKGVQEYASFLFRTTTPEGRLRAFQDALKAQDVNERIRAAEQLAKARDGNALEVLKREIEDAVFVDRTAEEKKAFLAAVVAISGKQATGFLTNQARRQTGIFKRRGGAEVREAAEALLDQLSRQKLSEGRGGGG